MTREDLGRALMQAAHIQGTFQLQSGVTSMEYFDKYRFESQPELLYEVALRLRDLLPDAVDAVAGLELGGVPVAAVLSQVARIPALFVRKAAKEYGTRQLVEGGDVSGKRIVVVEDVITSGGQVVKSATDLRRLGADVVLVLCVIDRENGGRAALAAEGFALKSLYTLQELRAGSIPRSPST